MTEGLMLAGRRLAEALRAENEALAALDLGRAAALAAAKVEACNAFAAAQSAAAKQDGEASAGRNATVAAIPPAEDRRAAEQLAALLQALGAENRRLLERAITLQSRVIETIAGVAIPRAAGPGRYEARGTPRRPSPGQGIPPLALSARA
ncbi:hypothetical protein GCM10010964_14960 [Caldovatus sediminis]|uniref:Uncharacterized protein n=1 Tax=Caldovatus sediminis TaxID=2041189 RepID=A0A8J2Z9W3_9PROT|nr:hypothetical protein [Caldovatus sediminis]GGG28043.1 hypothetical protein GCM10010964_14960 [Caldovatus sediminis]